MQFPSRQPSLSCNFMSSTWRLMSMICDTDKESLYQFLCWINILHQEANRVANNNPCNPFLQAQSLCQIHEIFIPFTSASAKNVSVFCIFWVNLWPHRRCFVHVHELALRLPFMETVQVLAEDGDRPGRSELLTMTEFHIYMGLSTQGLGNSWLHLRGSSNCPFLINSAGALMLRFLNF